MVSHDPNRTKTVTALRPDDHGSSAPTSLIIEVDTRGFRWSNFCLQSATIAGTSIAVKIQESDVAGSGHVDFTNNAFTTITTSTDNALECIVLDNSVRKRFLILDITFVSITVSAFSAVCTLSEATPATACPL